MTEPPQPKKGLTKMTEPYQKRGLQKGGRRRGNKIK